MNGAGRRPRIVLVSGHDPSGGAGIDADRSAVRDLDVDVAEVITAFTDQDDSAVRKIGAREPADWLADARRAVQGGVAAVKFGLLPGAVHVRAAAVLVRELRVAHADAHAVVDPVMRSTSGAEFLDAHAIEIVRGELARSGVILTPNLHEAAALACVPIEALTDSLSARAEAARILLALGARAVVLKGGHGSEDPVRDLVAEQDAPLVWHEHPRVSGGGIRGSGCRFAAHLSAKLALGATLAASARAAGLFVAAEIAGTRKKAR